MTRPALLGSSPQAQMMSDVTSPRTPPPSDAGAGRDPPVPQFCLVGREKSFVIHLPSLETPNFLDRSL